MWLLAKLEGLSWIELSVSSALEQVLQLFRWYWMVCFHARASKAVLQSHVARYLRAEDFVNTQNFFTHTCSALRTIVLMLHLEVAVARYLCWINQAWISASIVNLSHKRRTLVGSHGVGTSTICWSEQPSTDFYFWRGLKSKIGFTAAQEDMKVSDRVSSTIRLEKKEVESWVLVTLVRSFQCNCWRWGWVTGTRGERVAASQPRDSAPLPFNSFLRMWK